MRDLLTGLNVVDLSTAIAARRHEAPILTEPNTANHALMRKVVHQLDVKPPRHTGIEDRMPVLSNSLHMRRELLRIEVTQLIADALQVSRAILEVDAERGIAVLVLIRRRCRASDCGRAWERVGLVLLGSSWRAEAATTKARVTWAWRGRRLRRLRPVA